MISILWISHAEYVPLITLHVILATLVLWRQSKQLSLRVIKYSISLYGCGSERSEYGNPAIWLAHKQSDITRIACSGGDLKLPWLSRIKIKIFDNIWSDNVLRTSGKRKVTLRSKVGEKVLYEMTTELQVFIWRSVLLHVSIIFY